MKTTAALTGVLSLLTLLPNIALATVDVSPAELAKRAIWSSCATWGSSVQGGYTAYQNLWGASAGTGSQCMELTSVSGTTFAWKTNWSWSGGSYNVKSYDNIAYNIATGIKVSTISSIPTSWTWSQTGTNPVNNVSYDLMTTATSDVNGSHTYEIMIWLAAFGGAGPISSSGSPVSTPTVAGRSWKLYDGYNGSMRVFSFVATSTITSFSADLMDFLKYLATNNGFNTGHYLTVLQAGTEPFTGSNVVLTTSSYTVTLRTGATASSSSSSRSTSRASSTSSAPSGGATSPVYGQCGGQGYTGPTVCAAGSTCKFSNTWYSQCLPN
ncbi:Xyloglucan-specific endo-beta-1,4-glucanase A; AltName: Full=Xyloglucanase A; AltName: Full=Xyloglucanendohydrolase A; Flags: Precursor [Serendipita indica DSM 11827]|nr:Xyloglucan-specific endo-beta-1,4-glucanase A; AltName: Full=Xyloglucanase A; AltName: Full=Xyloglucanendohydrolase A; Flags: Precursor [Serendipita indica DSM 11827]